MSEKRPNVPKLRFPGFTEPWEQRKLGEVANRVTRKNEGLESQLPLTISAQYGLVDQETFFKKRVASKDLSRYYLMKEGEFAYNKSTSSESPWGAVRRLDRYKSGCVSTLYIVFEVFGVEPQFLATYYETDRWFKGVCSIATEGARNHGLLNIAPADFFKTTLSIPTTTDEQRQIGTFFSSLDDLITLHQRKEHPHEKAPKIKCIRKARRIGLFWVLAEASHRYCLNIVSRLSKRRSLFILCLHNVEERLFYLMPLS